MYVRAGNDVEVRLTLELAVDLLNELADAGDDPGYDAREVLARYHFSRAPTAAAAAVRRVEERMRELVPLLDACADDRLDRAVATINEALTELPIAPSLTAHDGAALHLHWTPATAAFDDQVIADVLMAFSHELCDRGTARFGRCAATGCDHLFYDTTRNGSRRFCSDPRCASRTHTADHRARRRAG